VITKRGKSVAELRPIPVERRPLERGCVKNDRFSAYGVDTAW
jgi:hypothetical protein